MADEYFPALEEQAFGIGATFDFDGFKLWIERQQWNFSKSITVSGDLVSANWDGASPLDLSSVDTTATAGFALDSSEGSIQAEGDIFVGGDISIQSGGKLSVHDSGGTEIWDMSFASGYGGAGNAGIDGNIRVFSPHYLEFPGFSESVSVSGDWNDSIARWGDQNTINTEITGGPYWLVDTFLDPQSKLVEYAIYVKKDGEVVPPLVIDSDSWEAMHIYSGAVHISGGGTSTDFALIGDTDTGLDWPNADELVVEAGGVSMMRFVEGTNDQIFIGIDGTAANPALAWDSDTDSGFYYVGIGQVGVTIAGTKTTEFTDEWQYHDDTCSLLATSSNPTLGTGSTASMKWMRAGNVVHVWINIIFGSSGVNAGSGTYYVDFEADGAPAFHSSWGTASTDRAIIGTWEAKDAGSSVRDGGIVRYEADLGRIAMFRDGNSGHVSHNVPHTWAANDILRIQLHYPTNE